MKTLSLAIITILLIGACNDPDMMDPTTMDPKLEEIKAKWSGDFIGTVTEYRYSPYYPSTYDTLYNQKIEISNFTRDSVHDSFIRVSMEFNDNYIDSGYYGLETELLSDTALLTRFDETFTDSHSEIKLNQTDSTLITDYTNYPLPGAGTERNGYYKRK